MSGRYDKFLDKIFRKAIKEKGHKGVFDLFNAYIENLKRRAPEYIEARKRRLLLADDTPFLGIIRNLENFSHIEIEAYRCLFTVGHFEEQPTENIEVDLDSRTFINP